MSAQASEVELTKPLCLRVGCKVNLSLQITALRPNGYHELDSIFYPLPEPYDLLHIERQTSGKGILCTCDSPGIDPHHNTLTRAYDLFAAATRGLPSLHVHLVKGIPHGAGLGGGSADAAALLRYLNTQVASPLPEAHMQELATKVGADVPFFLQKAPCRVRGIGEILETIPFFLSGWGIVVLCPPLHVSTPWAYGAWDLANLHKKVSPCLTSLPLKAKEFVFRWLCVANTFEAVVFAAHPSLRVYKELLLQSGANAAIMSGSGASLLGLFKDPQAALDTAQHLQYTQGLHVYGLAL